jgi:NAD(P)-dependent dehydrogenase (short-subunit alcohol dehydrogenase family)
VNGKFSNKIIIVAGGTGGLGRAVSVAFLDEGAHVIVTYHEPQEFDALKSAARTNPSALEGHPVDLTNDSATAEFIARIIARHARIDALVNAVGAYAGGIPLWDLKPGVLDQMLALNLRAGYALSHAAVPAMLKQKSGAIVNVVARAAIDHAAGASAYAASKAAALAMTDSLAADLKGTGVRVNSILPSIIDTPANRKAMPSSDFALWPKPEDIARVILFLCGDDAKVIHGAAVPVYGYT